MRRYIALAGAAMLGACGGSKLPTAPLQSATVTFSSSSPQRGGFVVRNGQQVYQCTFSVSASAQGGSSADAATFDSGELNWTLASNGQGYSSSLSALDLQDWLGADRVKSGGAVSGAQSVSWSGPFTIAAVFRYTVFSAADIYGESHSATVPLICQ